MENINEDFYENLVKIGGCGFVINYATVPLMNLGQDKFEDVIFVNVIDCISAVGISYEVSKSGYLPAILTTVEGFYKILDVMGSLNFALVILIKGSVSLDITSITIPYCRLDAACFNAAKVANVASSTRGQVLLLMD